MYTFICESIPAASIFLANPGHLLQNESQGPGIWQLIVSRPPAHLQTTKKILLEHPVAIPNAAQSQELQAVKHCHFGVGEEHLSTRRPTK